MRTTLTLDDDVAAALERLRRARDGNFKDLVNEALRRGLKEIAKPSPRGAPFVTRRVELGPVRLASIDNVAEVLAIAEGEAFK